MYSEIDELARQLEYCILVRKVRAAEEIVKKLCILRANLSIDVKLLYQCLSHYEFFGQEFISGDIWKFQSFQSCSHRVCSECLKKYITETFEKHKAYIPYYCPGCIVQQAHNPTRLDYKETYFKVVIPSEIFEKHIKEFEEFNKSKLELMSKSLDINCFKLFDQCQVNRDLYVIPACSHIFCFTCLKEYILSKAIKGEQFLCPRQECNLMIDHNIIEQLFNQTINEEYFVLNQLRLEKTIYIDCPKCRYKEKLERTGENIKCRGNDCNATLCKVCGKLLHVEIYCDEVEYGKPQIYKLYECDPSLEVPELRRYYYHAASLYHWDIVNARIDQNAHLAPNMREVFKYNLNKVFYISNFSLEAKFKNARDQLEKKLGRKPEEKYVFHGSKYDILALIARDGFKIGGVNVSKAHGDRHGLGIYTAGDPVTSIFYSQATNTIMVAKALIGNRSDVPINDEETLKKTQNDYYMVENDVVQKGSDYYIFFNTEHLLPMYLITLK